MTVCKWRIVGSVLAAYFEGRLPSPCGGAVLVGEVGSEDGTVVAYAKGDRGEVETVADLLRCWLRGTGLTELAFSPSRDRTAWAAVVRSDDGFFHTAAGRAFHAEMLRQRVEEAVYAAWLATRGTEPAESPEAQEQPQWA